MAGLTGISHMIAAPVLHLAVSPMPARTLDMLVRDPSNIAWSIILARKLAHTFENCAPTASDSERTSQTVQSASAHVRQLRRQRGAAVRQNSSKYATSKHSAAKSTSRFLALKDSDSQMHLFMVVGSGHMGQMV
eukprot:SAG31_NODE_7132_length_1780_cov_2.946460_1_plen_134_part_00